MSALFAALADINGAQDAVEYLPLDTQSAGPNIAKRRGMRYMETEGKANVPVVGIDYVNNYAGEDVRYRPRGDLFAGPTSGPVGYTEPPFTGGYVGGNMIIPQTVVRGDVSTVDRGTGVQRALMRQKGELPSQASVIAAFAGKGSGKLAQLLDGN